MPAFKNVAIAGASGDLGSLIMSRFLANGNFKIRALTRGSSTSQFRFPSGVEVVEADFASVKSLTDALQGQDLVVSAVAFQGFGDQMYMIEAAVLAGVQRFIPSEFGSSLEVASIRRLPVFATKLPIQDLLIEKARTTTLTYTFIFNMALLDWGLQQNFLLDRSTDSPLILNGGDAQFSVTTMSSAADAVLGVALHPNETRNRPVRVQNAVLTQNKLLALARRALPGRTFTPVPGDLDALTAQADARLDQGLYDMETFTPYMYRAAMDPASSARFYYTDNELLNVGDITDEEIVAMIEHVHN